MSILQPNILKRAWLNWSLRLAVTAICLAFLWHLVDMQYIAEVFATCRWEYLAVAAILYFLGALGGGFAWLYLLRGINECRLSFWAAMRLTWLGFVFNNLVPGGVAGDLFRVMGAASSQVPTARGAATVVLERWTSLLALFMATILADIWAWPWLKTTKISASWLPSWLPNWTLRLDIFTGLAVIAVLAAFLMVSFTLWRVIKRHGQAPQKLQEEASRLGASWHEFLGELTLFDTPNQRRQLLIASLINTVSPLMEGFSCACIAIALGLDLPAFLFLAFTPIFRLVSHIPVSINSIGPQEFVALLLWEPLGAAPSAAVTISLIIHILKIALSVVGLPLLMYAPKTISSLQPAASAESASEATSEHK